MWDFSELRSLTLAFREEGQIFVNFASSIPAKDLLRLRRIKLENFYALGDTVSIVKPWFNSILLECEHIESVIVTSNVWRKFVDEALLRSFGHKLRKLRLQGDPQGIMKPLRLVELKLILAFCPRLVDLGFCITMGLDVGVLNNLI